MGCNSLECITLMSPPLFFGSPGNTQESRHITLSLPEHKGETSQPGVLASETNRRLVHHQRENEYWALHWLILLMQAL